MKSVLISIQPYWLFLIIANKMGWEIGKHKTVEVRKNYPKSEDWDKTVKLYCSKDKKSFAIIPKEYQPLMEQFLGKVVGEFVCDKIISAEFGSYVENFSLTAQLTAYDLMSYARGKTLYGWHISNLVIYDKPKELGEFSTLDNKAIQHCEHRERVYQNPDFTNGAWLLGSYVCNKDETDWCTKCKTKPITRPPQSWCYVESEAQGE
jgi:predicted transcriptional regulator